MNTPHLLRDEVTRGKITTIATNVKTDVFQYAPPGTLSNILKQAGLD